MAIRLDNAVRDVALDAINVTVNTGSGTTGATINIYVGAVGTFGVAPAGNLITSITMNSTAFAPSSNGVMIATLATPEGAPSGAAYVAGSFTIANKDGVIVLDGNVSATGGGGDLQLSDINIGSGVVISIPTVTLTAGNSPA